MLCEFGFFPEIQKWIFEDELPLDQDTLEKYQANEKSVLFLLLLQSSVSNNKETNLTKKYWNYIPHMVDETQNSTDTEFEERVGWECENCTFINFPSRPGCLMCSTSRPENYSAPVNYIKSKEEIEWLNRVESEFEQENENLRLEEEEKRAKYESLVQAHEEGLIEPQEQFNCVICFETIQSGNGIRLKECLHEFCKDCIKHHILYTETADIKCPSQNDGAPCSYDISHLEIQQLISDDDFRKFNLKSLRMAEAAAGERAYHCKTVNCEGWCEYDEEVNFFNCPVCSKPNCLTCKAIHEGKNCKEYQEDLKIAAQNDDDKRKTEEKLLEFLKTGDAMKCPQCSIVITKKAGCDWIQCSMCKTEICWATKGRRWGPKVIFCYICTFTDL